MNRLKKVITSSVGSFILWLLFSVYLLSAYHLLLLPLILDYSIYGILLSVAVITLIIYLIPKEHRRQVVVFAILFLFAGKSFSNIGFEWNDWFFALVVIPMIVIYVLAKGYGKLPNRAIIALLLSSLLFNILIPRNIIPVLNHFTVKWVSSPLYVGKTIDFFPHELVDIDHDGVMEIVTLGNSDEVKESQEETQSDNEINTYYLLDPEPLFPYVYKWNNGTMERLLNDEINMNDVTRVLPTDYPGFPYYVWNDNQLQPLVQRQDLAEGMLQFGTSPFRAMKLNIDGLTHELQRSGGILDSKDVLRNSSSFSNLQLKNGQLIGLYNGNSFTFATLATKIVEGIQFNDQSEGVLLLGEQLEIIKMDEHNHIYISHQLGNEELKNLNTAEVIVADLGNQRESELLLSFPTESETLATIVKPVVNGEWQTIWTADNTSFRFEDLIYNDSKANEIITLDKSKVSDHSLRYLTGYAYENGKIKKLWKSFLSLINVRSGDVVGNGKDQLVASIYGSHQIYVLERHHIPIEEILLGITVLLIGYGIKRRVRYAQKSS